MHPVLHSIYRLDAQDRVTDVNDAWRAFAVQNGAPELAHAVLGRPLWDFLAGSDAKNIYRALIARVRGGRSVSVPYRCDAPDRVREFELVLTPREAGSIECATWVRGERTRSAVRLLDAHAPRTGDFVRMCGWCKRVRVDDDWAEPEDAVRRLGLFTSGPMPQVSHGICAECSARLLDDMA